MCSPFDLSWIRGEATYIPTSLSSNLPYFYLIGREIVLIVLAPDTSINLLQPMTYRNGLKESPLITELPSVSDRSITVGHVSNRPARDRRAPLLILRKKELSYYLLNNKLITSIHLMKILRLQRQRKTSYCDKSSFKSPFLNHIFRHKETSDL